VAGLLGEIHTSRCDLERADLLWQQALDDHARAGTPDDTTAVLRARVLQGQVDAMQGELVSSRAILEPALATLRHRLDADGLLPPIERQELRQTLARGAEALGQTLHLQGDSGAAVHLIREALVIHRQEGDVEGEVAAATSLTMPLHVAAGDDGSDAAVDHALQTHQRAIDALGHDHPLATRSGNELAVLLTELHRHDEALPLYEQITATTERVLGQGHPETITQLTNLAVSQARNGDRSAAVKTARHATDQAREHLGSTSIDFAHASRLLMILLRDGGRAGEAVDTAVASADAFWAMHELPPQEAIRPTLDAAYVVLVAGGEAAQVKPLLDPLLKRLSVDRLEAMEPDLLDVHAMLWVFNHCQELDVTADHLASFAVPWFAEMRRQGGRPAVRPAIEAMRAADAIGDTTTRDSTARYLHVIGRQYPDVVPAADYAEALEVLLESAEATGDTASAATLQARLLATAGPESR
jgi:tetratricopeptide (TPR) repeat protein